MTTALQGPYVAFTCTNLTQTLSYTEGVSSVSIPDLVFIPSTSNYSRVYTLTLTINAPSQAASILLSCSLLNGLSLTRVGNVYTISSQYTNSEGIVINNWPYFMLALKNLSMVAANSDLGESFSIATSITDETTTLTGSLQFITTSVPDVSGHNQTLTIPMAANGITPTYVGGSNIVINDPNQANKTYRVTFTANNTTNSTGTSQMHLTTAPGGGTNSGWVNPLVITGTQSYINSQIYGNGTKYYGLCFVNYNPDFQGQTTVSYKQEVLTSTEVGAIVPYVQETGTITLNTSYTAPFTVGSNPTYIEDSSVTFSLGAITDQSQYNYPYETCGLYSGLNCFTLTATVAGTFTAENPVFLTYSGDTAINNSVTFTGTAAYINGIISSLQLIPPADYNSNLTINITVTRGNTPVAVYTGSMTATCSTTHADLSIISGTGFSLGANTINFGSITDLATSKNYIVTIDATGALSSTRGNLSDPTGRGVWDATGGVSSFGRMTISGTKTQVNDSLDGLVYTTVAGATVDDLQTFLYTQTQTTNNLVQGNKNIAIANNITWQAGNGIHSGQTAFTYNQDTSVTWNLATLGGVFDTTTTYTTKLVFSTPINTSNLGSITGWTRETDYIYTLSGTRSVLNTALAAVVFAPPAALVSDFTLDIKVYNGATLLFDTSSLGTTHTIYIDQILSATWTSSSLSFNQDSTVTWSNLATLSSLFGSGTYTIRLITNVPTGGSIAGWTTIDSYTFSKTDTKANLQTALNSIVFTAGLSLITSFTFALQAIRSSVAIYYSPFKTISTGTMYAITASSGSTYSQDTISTISFGTMSSNFNNSSIYTITLTSDTADIGSIAGWATASSYTFTKTDTGVNLIAAMNALVFTPTISLISGFTLSAVAVKTSVTITTTAIKTIALGAVYSFSFATYPLTFDQDRTKTFTNAILPNSLFNNANTYTFTITTNVDNVGTFTGWTKINSRQYTKTDTGANLITACNSLVYTSPINLVSTFTIRMDAQRSGITVVSSAASSNITLTNVYTFTAAASKSIVYNITSNLLSSIGTLNSWFVDTDTYLLSAVLSIPATSSASITGSGWTVVSGTSITISGNKTAIQTALTSGITLTTPTYLNSNGTLTLSISKSGTSIQVKTIPITVTSIPTISLDQWKPIAAGNTGYPYDFVGYTRNMDSYKNIAPYDVYNRDLCDTIQIGNLPSDSSLYQIVVETTNANIFGLISSSALTWSQEVAGRWISSAGTSSQIATALTDVKLHAGSSAPATSTNTSNITVKLRAPLPFIETVSTTRPMANNAEIGLKFASTNGFYFYGTSGVFQIGWIQVVDSGNNLIYSYMDPAATYTIQINLGGSGTTVVGWTNAGSNVYTMSGNIAFLNDKLKNFSMTATVNSTRYVSFDLYYGGVLMSTQGHEIRTN